MNYRSKVRYSKLALGLAIALASAPAMAQQTSANVGGRITTAEQAVVAGAQVTITHVPSGTVAQATTDANGRYGARGLRVGGPYTITVTKDGKTETIENVFLTLAQTTQVDATIGAAAATTLDTVEVTADAVGGPASPFSANAMGAGTTIVREQIEALPTIRRSIEDFVRLDSRIVQVDEERGGIAAAGQNNRYNNIRIDGVPTNDNFGLNDSGLPSLNQPISVDWIQEFNVGISDYDTTQTDFVGANVNAVTKSGGNEFAGRVYYVFRNDDMIGDEVNGVDVRKPLTDEFTSGGYFGGPLIKDRLFFFAGYEKFEREIAGVDNGIAGSGAVNQFRITQAEIDRLRAAAARYGAADVGSFDPVTAFTNEDEKWFAKLDFNISDNQRATLRYNKTTGSDLQANPGVTQIRASSNHWANDITFESWAALLYSDWTDVFSTEANVSYSTYDSLPTAFSRFQLATVNFPNGSPQGGFSSVNIGQEFSRQANQLNTDTLTAFFAGNLYLGDHEVKFGFDYERVDVFNLFLQAATGAYTFDTLADFEAGNWSRYQFQRSRTGNLNDVAASFDVGSVGFFVQDTWSVNYNLTLMFGLRADQSLVGGNIPANARFSSDFGIDNRTTPDGEWLVQPRFGFNYTFDGDLQAQLRGGVGLFRGSAPGVWLSNSFSNPGVVAQSFDIRTTPTTRIPGVSLNPAAPFVPAAAAPGQLVNAVSDDFTQPSVYRANLAFEHELPFMGLVAGVEYLYTSVNDAVNFLNVSLGNPTGTLPDGRQSFWLTNAQSGFVAATGAPAGTNRIRANCVLVNPAAPFNLTTNPCAYTNAIVLTNTDKGRSENFTVSLEKPWADNWYAKVAYTYGSSDEVNPGTSSVALSNWNNRIVVNPNEDVLRTSNYEISDRLTASFSYRFEFFGENAPTTITGFYEGRYGRPYSFVYSNDANGDGQGGNDVFFVPAMGSVAFTADSSAADQQAFWDYLRTTPGLAGRANEFSEINGQKSPWRNQIDVRISQDLPLGFGKTKAQLFLDIENFGNLLNKDWGGVEEAPFPYSINVARFQGVNAAGQTVLDVRNFVNETTGAATGVPVLPFRNFESRWAAQVGVRIDF
jgi:hypothetical protein